MLDQQIQLSPLGWLHILSGLGWIFLFASETDRTGKFLDVSVLFVVGFVLLWLGFLLKRGVKASWVFWLSFVFSNLLLSVIIASIVSGYAK